MSIRKSLCLIVVLLLSLSQFAVGVFADTNYCAKCRHSCPDSEQHGTASSRHPCSEAPKSCCEITPCQIVQVQEIPFLATETENQTSVGILSILTENLADIHLQEGSGIQPHLDAIARSAPLYLQNLSLLC
jgi:hypothetical protein